MAGVRGAAIWLVVVVVALASCKAVRERAVKKYDERRAVEKAEERAAMDRAAKEEAERPVPPPPSGPGLAPGRYRIVGAAVTVFATNAKGRPWDDPPGIDPDLRVKVRVDGGKAHECEPPEETVNVRCELDVEIELAAGSKIELEVIDRDTVVDDPIGTAVIADPSRWGIGMAMPMVPQQRVWSAEITLARVPTWWELNQSRVLGLGIGAALALGVLALFRGALLRKDEPESEAIWHVPVLVIAGLAAFAGIGVSIGVVTEGLPAPFGPAIQWGLAAASLTWTFSRVIHLGSVRRRELELLVIASAIFVAPFVLAVAAVLGVLGVLGFLIDEFS